MGKQYHTSYIRLYRVIDAEEEVIESELRRLGEFIKQRSGRKKNISYITLTMIDKERIDGLIIIRSNNKDLVEREAEIIVDYIDSNMETISARKIENPRNIEAIPIPITRSFFGEGAGLD
jgi:hypothetical protein